MHSRIALVGSGNVFFKDEGIGLYAAKYLKENYVFEPSIEIIDGGTLGFKLMPLLLEHDEVVIVNTASEDGAHPGSIVVKDTETFLDGKSIKKTANEVEIAEMLQICALSEESANVTLVSIVPEDIISVEVGLSESLQNAWSDYISVIIEALRRCEVSARRRETQMSLEAVLQLFADPSIEYARGF